MRRIADKTTGLFGAALPEQPHPSARITWCGYPAPEGRHPAQDCLSWMGGGVDEPADCRGCVHLLEASADQAAPGPRHPLVPIAADARVGKPPCGECHLKPGERCDICGAISDQAGDP